MMQKILGATPLFFSLLFGSIYVHAQDGQLSPEEQGLLGQHPFGVQFIWDGYGSAVVMERDGTLYLTGEQYSKDGEEYLRMNGTISVVDSRNFTFHGRLVLFTKGCCGLLDREVSYTFRKTGNRKYWRLKEREDLCSPYTCAYYLDIFE